MESTAPNTSRYRCRHAVEFDCPGNNKPVRANLVDIGRDGMRLRLEDPVALAEPALCRFTVWVDGSMFRVRGQLVRVAESEAHVVFEDPVQVPAAAPERMTLVRAAPLVPRVQDPRAAASRSPRPAERRATGGWLDRFHGMWR